MGGTDGGLMGEDEVPDSDSSLKVTLREAAIRLGVCEEAMRESRENTAALVGGVVGVRLRGGRRYGAWADHALSRRPDGARGPDRTQAQFRRVEAVFIGRPDSEDPTVPRSSIDPAQLKSRT